MGKGRVTRHGQPSATCLGDRVPSFCIVLPMYNEAANAERCIRRISAFLEEVDTRTAIIVVDDGSVDGTTGSLARAQAQLPNVWVVSHPVNKGYGQANRTGLKRASAEGFEYAVVMDGDGTQDPREVAGFFALMRDGVQVIKATRYAKGGRVEGVAFGRRAASWLGNRLAMLMLRLPISDYTNGFRAIRTDIVDRLPCKESGFEMLMEEIYLARRMGATFAEVPYTLRVRDAGDSKSKFSYSWTVYRNYLKYLFKR